MSAEPLRPDPQWVYTPGAGWHSRRQGGASIKSPADYAEGFEQGAYALADKLTELIAGPDTGTMRDAETRLRDALALLSTYDRGNAHPARGWEHEPKRN